jgi:hypothetical protein
MNPYSLGSYSMDVAFAIGVIRFAGRAKGRIDEGENGPL